eukprot:12432267-Alexandrium_andersonii.AAC.1
MEIPREEKRCSPRHCEVSPSSVATAVCVNIGSAASRAGNERRWEKRRVDGCAGARDEGSLIGSKRARSPARGATCGSHRPS